MSKYPRDEFDSVEENSARYGVHRASMDTQARSLMPLMVVGVVALCIGLLAFFIMPKMFNNNTPPLANNTSSSVSSPADAQTSAAPTDETSETATDQPTDEVAPEPTEEPTPEVAVDKSTGVAVFNATGIGGLAARYAGLITGDGWTVTQSANWAGQPQGTSAIFYSDPAQKANAEELGTLLNIPTQVESAELGIPLAVVLGPGA